MLLQSKQEAAKRLRIRLLSAHKAYMEALSRLDVTSTGTGQQSNTEARIAYQQYMDALQQATEFARSGVAKRWEKNEEKG